MLLILLVFVQASIERIDIFGTYQSLWRSLSLRNVIHITPVLLNDLVQMLPAIFADSETMQLFSWTFQKSDQFFAVRAGARDVRLTVEIDRFFRHLSSQKLQMFAAGLNPVGYCTLLLDVLREPVLQF
jgi:hypothetical protein